MMGHEHGPDGHTGTRTGRRDSRYSAVALGLILAFMAVEVVVGIIASSLALISDAGHMLTDAAAIALALIAARLAARPAAGNLTYGWKRVEILSAQANGITLWLLTAWFLYEGIRRLLDPPEVEGGSVLVTALVGIVVNVMAAWLIARADRTSLNVEGAFQHILNDLFAFIATAVAGLVILIAGWTRADAIAALIVAALMAKAGWGLIRESWRIFLEAAPVESTSPQSTPTCTQSTACAMCTTSTSGKSRLASPRYLLTSSWIAATTVTNASTLSPACSRSGTASTTSHCKLITRARPLCPPRT